MRTILIFATFRHQKGRSMRLYVDNCLMRDFGPVSESEFHAFSRKTPEQMVKEAKRGKR